MDNENQRPHSLHSKNIPFLINTLKEIEEENSSVSSYSSEPRKDIESPKKIENDNLTIVSDLKKSDTKDRGAKSSVVFSEREFSLFEKQRTLSRRLLSFYNGKPRTEQALERITDPFYTCDKTLKVAVNKDTGHRREGLEEVQLINTLEIKTFKSMFMTILQIINSIIRYTIVQFPYCIRVLGLIYGPIIISTIAIMSIYSVYMLIKIKNYTNKR